MTCFRAYCMWR